MEAARREIHRHGFRAASLNRILATTGLTKGAVYHHFPNKQALGYAVVEEILEKMVAEIWTQPLSRAENPIDCLQNIKAGFYDQVDLDLILLGCPLNNLSVEMSFEDEGFRLRIQRIYDNWRSTLTAALFRGQEKGYVRPEADPEAAASFVVAGVSGIWSLVKSSQNQATLTKCLEGMADYWESLRA